MKRSLLFISAIVALATQVVHPCSFIVVFHELDPIEKQLDHVPPSPPQMSVFSIQRGRGPNSDGSGSSCDDIGVIVLKLDQPTQDDRTLPDKIGYLWQVSDGQPPAELVPPSRPVRLRDDGLLSLVWVDGATDEQEPLDFSVTVTAFDLAGNESQPSEPIHIQHPGHK